MNIKTVVVAYCALAFAGASFAATNPFRMPAEAANDPALKACLDGNAKLDKDIDLMFATAKSGKLIEPEEAAKYQAMEANIDKQRAALSKKGYSLKDCLDMTAVYNQEKTSLQQMITLTVAEQKKIDACVAANTATEKANADLLVKAKAVKRTPKDQPIFESALKQAQTQTASAKANMATKVTAVKCGIVSGQLGKEKAFLEAHLK